MMCYYCASYLQAKQALQAIEESAKTGEGNLLDLTIKVSSVKFILLSEWISEEIFIQK